MADTLDNVRDSILEAIKTDRITLPTLPEVALNIREVARNPDTTVIALCNVLENDAAIAARVIKVANSPLFRGGKAIDNLKTATTRLGVRYTANLATGIAMKQMFQATTSLVDDILRATWTNSTEIAAYAQLQLGLHPDQASLAWLTYRIGVLPILIPNADYADLVAVSALQGAEDSKHPLHHIDIAKVKALDRLSLRQAASEVEQNQMIEHIELAAATYSGSTQISAKVTHHHEDTVVNCQKEDSFYDCIWSSRRCW